MSRSALPDEVPQCLALTRAFVLRFFENEITAGSSDLRSSFFWLLSLLVPAFCIPFLAIMKWTTASYVYGAEGLRRLAWADKALIIGFGMVVAGAVSVVVWNALLIDRRDTLVLGVQPLRGRTIVVAKLLALGVYFGILIAGMHSISSFTFGMLLGNGADFAFAFRGIFAHFVAASLGSAFVFLAVCALQGVLLAALGPKLFARISPVVQLLLVVVVLASLMALPTIGGSAVRSLEEAGVTPLVVHARGGKTVVIHPTSGPGAIAHAWVADSPPIWFLGIYEDVLGDAPAPLRQRARAGIVAVLGALGLVLVAYPLAYRRMAVAAIENVDTRMTRRALVLRLVPRLVARHSTSRAAAQFLLTTLGRVERHRFVIAMTGGVAVALVIPVALGAIAMSGLPAQPTIPLLAAPFYVMACLTVGLRFGATLPGDLRASWIFHAIDADGWRARAGTWRVVFALAVLPIELIMTAIAWKTWGASFALTSLLVGLAVGGLLVEVVLSRTIGMPCAEPWRPRTEHLRAWWPVYLLGFLIFTSAAPALVLVSTRSTISFAIVLASVALLTTIVHLTRRSNPVVEDESADGPKLEVLSLN